MSENLLGDKMYEPALHIRRPLEKEFEDLADLIYRFYRFNEEFDPSYNLGENAKELSKQIAQNYISDEKTILLVADYNGKIIGYIKGNIVEKPLLAIKKMGMMSELYVIPSHRGMGVATKLIEGAAEELKRKGIEYMTVEFPTMNYIADNFYKTLGFRPFLSVYLKKTG